MGMEAWKQVDGQAVKACWIPLRLCPKEPVLQVSTGERQLAASFCRDVSEWSTDLPSAICNMNNGGCKSTEYSGFSFSHSGLEGCHRHLQLTGNGPN